MKIIYILILFILYFNSAFGQEYITNFPLTENPISQSGVWVNGLATGLDWSNVQTTSGLAFGNGSTTTCPTNCNDATAVLNGNWGPDQSVQATVVVASAPSASGIFQEVELRLRTTITAHSITGYEITCSVSTNGAANYYQMVRWNGALGNFTQLAGVSQHCVNGDVIKATMVGSTITIFLNGTQVDTVTDTTYTGGAPGIGFFLQCTSGCPAVSNAGFSAVTITGATTAASCSNADVQTAVTAAANGTRVAVPASSSATWTGGVTIPNTKGLTLDMTGCVLNQGSSPTAFPVTVNANATTPSRIVGISATGVYENSSGVPEPGIITHSCGGLSECGGITTAFIRIDHNSFTDSTHGATFIATDGNGPVLIDDNTFVGGAASEMIHNLGMGAGDANGWTDNVIPGSAYQVYVETNTFTFNATGNPAFAFGTAGIQSYFGARTVFRDNTCNMCKIDQHGTPGQVWARWWEIYNNTFATCVANAASGEYVTLRGGSGVVFGNQHTCADSATAAISIQVECGSPGTQCTGGDAYPQLYQVGRGISQNLSPAYFWNNTDVPTSSPIAVGSQAPQAQLNRDFFVNTTTQQNPQVRFQLTTDNSGTTYTYAPFTYPFPLNNNLMPNPGALPPAVTNRFAGSGSFKLSGKSN